MLICPSNWTAASSDTDIYFSNKKCVLDDRYLSLALPVMAMKEQLELVTKQLEERMSRFESKSERMIKKRAGKIPVGEIQIKASTGSNPSLKDILHTAPLTAPFVNGTRKQRVVPD
jgi:hypothetical protein